MKNVSGLTEMPAKNAKEMTGMIFGRLTVVSKSERRRWGQLLWNCICECGASASEIDGNSLRRGSTKSCGCLVREHQPRLTHGDTVGERAPEYRAWQGMIARCYDPTNPSHKRYGGRGISVCEEWLNSYEAFLSHIGRRPSAKYSVDRWPDNDGNYEPGNVRWATGKEQSRNKSNNRFVRLEGKKITVAEAKEILGLSREEIIKRDKFGML